MGTFGLMYHPSERNYHKTYVQYLLVLRQSVQLGKTLHLVSSFSTSTGVKCGWGVGGIGGIFLKALE